MRLPIYVTGLILQLAEKEKLMQDEKEATATLPLR